MILLLVLSAHRASVRRPGFLTQLSGEAGCLKGVAGAAWIPCHPNVAGLLDVRAVAISPDGRFAYAVSLTSQTLIAFSRNRSTGALSQLAGASGCLKDPQQVSRYVGMFGVQAARLVCPGSAPGLGSVNDLTISPDGRNLYVASGYGVTAFARNTLTGVLRELSGVAACIKYSGANPSPGAAALANEPPCSMAAHGLAGARSIRVSPDGRNVYTASSGASAINAFARDPVSGALTPLPGSGECTMDLLAPPSTACPVKGPGLNYLRMLDISPDGRNVYAVSDVANETWPGAAADGDAIAEFWRDPQTGKLTQLPGNGACIKDVHARPNVQCPTTTRGLHEPLGLAISPDGNNVYVASSNPGTVVAFARNTATGRLTPLDGKSVCFQNSLGDGPPVCPQAAKGIHGADAVAVSPDGGTVYVSAFSGDSVAVFSRRAADGELRQLPGRQSCLKDPRAVRWTDCPVTATSIQGARPIAISPDGRFAYVPASTSGTIVSFAIGSHTPRSGALSPRKLRELLDAVVERLAG